MCVIQHFQMSLSWVDSFFVSIITESSPLTDFHLAMTKYRNLPEDSHAPSEMTRGRGVNILVKLHVYLLHSADGKTIQLTITMKWNRENCDAKDVHGMPFNHPKSGRVVVLPPVECVVGQVESQSSIGDAWRNEIKEKHKIINCTSWLWAATCVCAGKMLSGKKEGSVRCRVSCLSPSVYRPASSLLIQNDKFTINSIGSSLDLREQKFICFWERAAAAHTIGVSSFHLPCGSLHLLYKIPLLAWLR